MNWLDIVIGFVVGIASSVGLAVTGMLHIKKHPEVIMQMMMGRAVKARKKSASNV